MMKTILHPGSETDLEEGCGEDQQVPRNQTTRFLNKKMKEMKY